MVYRRNPVAALMRSSPARARRYRNGPKYRRAAPIRRVAGARKRPRAVRRAKAVSRRTFAPSPSALFLAQMLNPFESSGHGLSDGSGQRTTIVKSLMRFSLNAPASNGVSRCRMRVMPAVGFAPGEAFGDVVGSSFYWKVVAPYSDYGGKIQLANSFLTSGDASNQHALNVERYDDDVFVTAQTQWDSYRPVALGVRLTNATALQNRGGTLYMCQSYFRDPHSGQGTALNSETVNNNFRVFLGAAPTPNGASRYGLVENHNFNPFSAITGNDSVLVLDAASPDLNKNIVHWTPLGQNDTHFANYSSRGPANHFLTPDTEWDVYQKFFQESGIDVLYEGTDAQTFQVEVCTIYEVVPERTIEEHFVRNVPRADPQSVAQMRSRVPSNAQGRRAVTIADRVVRGGLGLAQNVLGQFEEDVQMAADLYEGGPIENRRGQKRFAQSVLDHPIYV